MRVSVMSDLHLEFHDVELPGGDILILAGDCFLAACLREWRNDASNRSLHKRMVRFAEKELSKYRKVFVVKGNHEYYGEVFEDVSRLLREFFAGFAPHVTLLDNSSEIYEGVAFVGSALWAPHGHGKYAAFEIGRYLNDFRRISTWMPYRDGRRKISCSKVRLWTVGDAYSEHGKAKKYLRKALDFTKENGIPTIVITHHAPSLLSKSGRFKYSDDGMDEAYYSNQHKLIEDNPQIYMWVHGHSHDSCHYQIGNTKIISNQRGYFPDERCSRGFEAQAEDFELEEAKQHWSTDRDRAGDARDGERDDRCEPEHTGATRPSGTCRAG